MRAWRRAGFQPVGHVVWKKDYASSTGFVRARHEQAYLLAKGRPVRPENPIDDVRDWKYTGNVRHPTEKDPSILQPLIRCFSNAGDVVLGPFAGSGSTLIAAVRTGRCYLGIELEHRYCDLIRDRPVSPPAGRFAGALQTRRFPKWPRRAPALGMATRAASRRPCQYCTRAYEDSRELDRRSIPGRECRDTPPPGPRVASL